MGRGRTLNGYQVTEQTLYGGIEWVAGRTLNGYQVTVETLYGGIEWVGGGH